MARMGYSGSWENCFMKKTLSRKSRVRFPLKQNISAHTESTDITSQNFFKILKILSYETIPLN